GPATGPRAGRRGRPARSRTRLRPRDPSAALVLRGADQGDLVQAGAVDLAHYLHHPAVIEPVIGAQEDARPARLAARRRDLLQSAAEHLDRHRRIVDEDMPGAV